MPFVQEPRGSTPAAYCRYFDVLGETRNRQLCQTAFKKREQFTQSKTSPSKLYPDWRRSTVIYDIQIENAVSRLDQEIRLRLREVLAALRIPAFEIDSIEMQLTSHNDGEYYKWHTDNGTRETQSRMITFIYYFHQIPKGFQGGELVIYPETESEIVLEPQNDSLVFFSSHTRHEVKRIVCPSRRFEDGRFTLNGWIRRKHTPVRQDYFDHKIFRPWALKRKHESVGQSLVVPSANMSCSTQVAIQTDETPSSTPYDYDRGSSQVEPTMLSSLFALYADLYRKSSRCAKIDELWNISQIEFYENYYFLNRPVVLKEMMKSSVAVRTWSPEFFALNYGSVPLEITTDRNGVHDYESNFHQTVRTVLTADFIHRLSQNHETNDFYLVARNYFFDNPAFVDLRNHLEPPPDIVNTKDHGHGTVKAWFGPKGTVTPLHYDEHSILLAQIYGRKHFKFIPPFEFRNLYVRNKFYSAVDPEHVDTQRYPDFPGVPIADVFLEPGDLLFIPVGWWHWAMSLDVSISATFCSFHVEGRNTSLRAYQS